VVNKGVMGRGISLLIITGIVIVGIVGVVGISLVGSVLNPPEQKKIIEEDNIDISKWCEENYLEQGYSSVRNCEMAEIVKLER